MLNPSLKYPRPGCYNFSLLNFQKFYFFFFCMHVNLIFILVSMKINNITSIMTISRWVGTYWQIANHFHFLINVKLCLWVENRDVNNIWCMI